MVEGIILNLPASLVCAVISVILAIPPSQSSLRQHLQDHFELPLPASVKVESYRMERGLNEGTYAFAFSLHPSELGQFLSSSGCVLIDADSDDARLITLQAGVFCRIRNYTNTERPSGIYRSQTNRGIGRFTKTIFVDTNYMEVVFYEDFH